MMTFHKNEAYNKDMVERTNVINIGGFLDTYDNDPFSYDGVNIDEVEGLFAPMECFILVMGYNSRDHLLMQRVS